MNAPRSFPSADYPPPQLRRVLEQACDELERCLRAGQPCRSEDLLSRYPPLSEHASCIKELLRLEFALKQQLGLTPSPDDFCARFPQWRDYLESELPLLSATLSGNWPEVVTLQERRPPAETVVPARSGPLRRLGHYLLLERIGHGGMGDVYRAQQYPPLQRIVALKLLRTGDEFEVRTFEKEIEVARRLRHPNLLPIYDAGCIEGEYYYTMPLLPGGSLEKRLRRQRPDVRWTAALMEKIARAVHAAHQQGVLHRDLKPANILLDNNDEPLIADFGLAKLIDASLAQTQTGQLLGSVPYMSPEQAAGRGHRVTPASDVWSLGVILYEMLTGQRPFRGASHSEILAHIQQRPPFQPRQVKADVPADLEAICSKCLEKDSAERYASAEELADDLRHWLQGIPLPQPRTSLATRVRRSLPWQRNVPARVLLTLFFLAVLALSSWLPALTPTTPSADRQRKDVSSAEERLVPGVAVKLLGPQRPPRKWPLVLTQDTARIEEEPKGILNVDTLSYCLLEILPPDPNRQGYRLTVTLRLVDAGLLGETGLYFGRQAHRTAQGVGQSFAEILFLDPTNVAPEAAPLADGTAHPAVKYLLSPPRERTRPVRMALPQKLPLPPEHKRNNGPFWETLTLEVLPQTVRLQARAGQLEIPHAAWQQQFNFLNRLNPRLGNIPHDVSPRGGCGLYLYRGAIEVRDVEVELIAGDS